VKRNFISNWDGVCDEGKIVEFYQTGLVIFKSGDALSGLRILQRGLVKEFVVAHGGKQEIVRFVLPGSALAGIGVEQGATQLNATAHEESVICYFDNNALYGLYLANPKIIFDLMLYYSSQFSEVTARIKQLSNMNLREKIAYGILYFVKYFGLNEHNEISDKVNREDLANLVGTTNQQVSRQLTDFEGERLIDKRGRRLAVIDSVKLQEIARV
jgi:CRP-like cAMP-binding protein